MRVSILIIGILIIIILATRPFLKKTLFPEIVAFILFGFIVRAIDVYVPLISPEVSEIMEFLASIGIIVLLFRVGLESNIAGLFRQLKKSTFVVIVNVTLSGLLGYFVSRYIIHLEMISSLFIGVALTATSVGISTAEWRNSKKLRSSTGESLVDMAEMDDVLGIVIMALLFSIVPILDQGRGALIPVVTHTLTKTFGKLALFVVFCFVFMRFVEKPLMAFTKREPARDRMLTITGVGFIISAAAAMFGFSFAIGAFFAGPAFSSDPQAVKTDRSFSVIYDLFYPFFFLNIGLKMDPQVFMPGLGIGLVLLAVAIIGKFIGTALPVLLVDGRIAALLLGVSMIPRAEIALIVMRMGFRWTNCLSPTTSIRPWCS
ncbi:MAG: cation:proton antiporter [Candidatus Omnitrophica bacterium]|nr:cation:proton antiporter [Candidatus Omnitrophota bacterium]